jgi:hypothetical protein
MIDSTVCEYQIRSIRVRPNKIDRFSIRLIQKALLFRWSPLYGIIIYLNDTSQVTTCILHLCIGEISMKRNVLLLDADVDKRVHVERPNFTAQCIHG